jgi:hypothetical protein
MELEIKDTTDTDRSVSSLDLHLEIDNEGRLRSNLTTKEMMSMNRQHNGQKNKDKRRNNDLQNITQKTKDRATRKPLNM